MRSNRCIMLEKSTIKRRVKGKIYTYITQKRKFMQTKNKKCTEDRGGGVRSQRHYQVKRDGRY